VLRRFSHFPFLGGWTLLVLLFLYLPIARLIVYSFNAGNLTIVWQGFTLDWYAKLWHDAELMSALQNSLIVAGFATVFSTVFGTAAAWLLHRYRFPATALLAALVGIPIVIPDVVMGVSLLALFVVVRWQLGFATIIIAHITFCFPFVMVAIQARLAGLDPALEEAAMDLGATPLQAFLHVIVPYLLPAIVSGALLAFALSIDEYIVTSFIASPDSITLPMRIFGRARRGVDPSLNAISTIIIAGTVILVLAAEYARSLSRRTRASV
jgi:spermidine/putrescine transport system permease protein